MPAAISLLQYLSTKQSGCIGLFRRSITKRDQPSPTLAYTQKLLPYLFNSYPKHQLPSCDKSIKYLNVNQNSSTMSHEHSHDHGHSHDHDHDHAAPDHGHTHEILDGPGSYMGREMPIIEGRDWSERAFTVGIGG